jgi:hypothetical protein
MFALEPDLTKFGEMLSALGLGCKSNSISTEAGYVAGGGEYLRWPECDDP